MLKKSLKKQNSAMAKLILKKTIIISYGPEETEPPNLIGVASKTDYSSNAGK
ncbi:hypothetical protein LPB67_02260 [Undibacterium sp. Jales W-56]|uniref:hypothetical protein n=1 Tax=Undibacterium sp. Jales W-56 TaxID=2897325 RepID=UPI0021D30AE7|nr:hypothetical protein [Undibacterium sp. Jales W-56]MCU6432600.1 hypothetical protein [Undibacterium sp. Jales W-56]